MYNKIALATARWLVYSSCPDVHILLGAMYSVLCRCYVIDKRVDPYVYSIYLREKDLYLDLFLA